MLPTVGVGARLLAGTEPTCVVGTLPTSTGVGVTVRSLFAAAVAVARSVAISSTTRGSTGGMARPPFQGA